MSHVGNYIYSGFIPLVKMGFTIAGGFILTKKGLFPPAASKGASHLSMTIGLPCLIFASVVPAFNKSNIQFLGPLCLNAFVYECSGACLGFIIREIFWVPDDFQYGIIIACIFSNWGNLPTAVVQTIATQAPFDPSKDPILGVAYVSVFMLIYSITFFGLGTCKICAWDFRPRAPGDKPLTIKARWANRRLRVKKLWRRLRGQNTLGMEKPVTTETESGEEEGVYDLEKKGGMESGGSGVLTGSVEPAGYIGAGGMVAPQISRYRSHQEVAAEAYHDIISLAPVSSRASRVTISRKEGKQAGAGKRPSVHEEKDEEENTVAGVPMIPNIDEPGPSTDKQLQQTIQPHPHIHTQNQYPTAPAEQRRTPRQIMFETISTIFTPVSMSLFLALPIALIDPLKSLFTHVEGWTGERMPNSPDGKPPLAFLLETASFIGAICIPVGLMLLGSSFARLKIPRPFTRLPIGAIIAVTVAKMIIVPIIGVGMTVGLSNNTSMYPKDQKVLLFVAMLLSGTPAAVNQLVVTQIYSPDGSADTLSTFLAVQYAFMFLASAALAAIALALIS